MSRPSDKRLHHWHKVHRPLCPDCKHRVYPEPSCARVWATDWAAEYYSVNELEDPLAETVNRLQRELEESLEASRRAVNMTMETSLKFDTVCRELEQLRRDYAAARESAAEDFDAANNWRRFVATVGERRASFYIVPPKKGDEH